MPSIRDAAGLALVAATTLPSIVTAMPSLPPLNKIERRADPPTALPENATADDKKFQPAMDFDTDGCYNVPAIGADGRTSEGLDPGSGDSDGCRDPADLANNNVYARQRCNNGWCAYLYDYYFEKDTAFFGLGGHRHDWEHIAVWVQGGTPKFVSASQHGEYEIKAASDVRWDSDTHPKMVYHKDGINTHSFRFASEADEAIENASGAWFYGDLISWNGFPTTALRDTLVATDFGDASIAVKDDSFAGNLDNARDENAPEFDSAVDEGSPGRALMGGK